MKSKQILFTSTWMITVIIAIIISSSNVLSMAAASLTTDGTTTTTDGPGTTYGGGGGLYSCYGTLSCRDLIEVYPSYKLSMYCDGTYGSTCQWDETDSLCVNIDGASCSDFVTSSGCSKNIGCTWGNPAAVTPTCTSGETYCDYTSKCVDTSSDAANCGYCYHLCQLGATCEAGTCVSKPPCGDGYKVPNEECDASALKYTPLSCDYAQFHKGTQSCTAKCEWGDCLPIDGYCGNGEKDGTEVCDRSQPAEACTIGSRAGTRICKADCTGWNECMETKYCFPDCSADGRWTSYEDGFAVDADNKITFTGTGTGTLISDGLDLFGGKTYSFNANVEGNVKIYLNENCLSNTSFTQKDCGIGPVTLYDGSAIKDSFTIAKGSAGHAINGEFYRNVSIYMVFTGAGKVSGISLSESSTAHYDDYPEALSNEGCCPESYCWDGVRCVNSSTWMNNATYEPIWNNIFNETTKNWTRGHVNSSAVGEGVGYRCVKYNDTTPAAWELSRIKYDWDFIKSGYCGRSTDCFVTDNKNFIWGDGTSRGCVPTGSLVGGEATGASGGNHYCYMGNWTTKSYIVATLLQNISADRAYTLHCYNDSETLYNLVQPSNVNIISACVLTMPQDNQVITGVVLASDVPEDVNTYIATLAQNYKTSVGSDAEQYISCTSTTPELIEEGSAFAKCLTGTGESELHIYYDTQYKYLIISNKEVVGIEHFTIFGEIWMSIKNFFKELFGRSTILENVQPYTSLDYTTSYDRVYVLRDEGVNVTAIEEYKFDENLSRPVTVFYIKHEGSSQETNPINGMQIFKSINKTLAKSKMAVLNTEYIWTKSTQELIVRTDNTTGIWKYFTAVLRTRPPGGFGMSTAGANDGATSSGTSAQGITTATSNTPVDNTPVDNTPVDETPVDNTPSNNAPLTGAIIIDHTNTDISKIPDCWIEKAKEMTFQYAHRSDGGNILEGMEYLYGVDSNLKYMVKTGTSVGDLPVQENPIGLRIMDGNYPEPAYSYPANYWSSADGRAATEDNWASGKFSASMWSWCSEFEVTPSEAGAAESLAELYLTTMNDMESTYPNIDFIYMTSYTQNGNPYLVATNKIIRDYAVNNGKILYDFEDIGKYAPDGTYYPEADRGCTWCTTWCNAHPSECTTLPATCSHAYISDGAKGALVCEQRAKAYWWMMARLAGWDGVSTTCSG